MHDDRAGRIAGDVKLILKVHHGVENKSPHNHLSVCVSKFNCINFTNESMPPLPNIVDLDPCKHKLLPERFLRGSNRVTRLQKLFETKRRIRLSDLVQNGRQYLCL